MAISMLVGRLENLTFKYGEFKNSEEYKTPLNVEREEANLSPSIST
jgi:hypothetical protein